MEVNEKIDCTRPDYEQLYAQLKTELLAGERYWFTSEEELAIQKNNRMFYRHSPEEDVFFQCFRVPEVGEEGILLTPTEIFVSCRRSFRLLSEGECQPYGEGSDGIGRGANPYQIWQFLSSDPRGGRRIRWVAGVLPSLVR